MAFDVRLKEMETIEQNYNTQTLNKLQDTLLIMEKKDKLPKLIENDVEVHENGNKTIIDYVDEEYDNTVGYFKKN